MTTQVVPTDDVLGRFSRQQHDWFERVRKGSLDPEAVVRAVHSIIDAQYPADVVEFELTLDFDAPENQPLEMVRLDGYNPEGWKFTGKKLSGIQIRRFKLVRVGHCLNLDEVRLKLAQYGREVPEGQWRQAFKAAYPNPDGNGPIGFADPSWVSPLGRASFPFVDSVGGSGFSWAGCGRGGRWRWLVPASK